MNLRQHLEEELRKDFQLLKQLEDKRRCENDPRQILKWDADIAELKQQIHTRQVKLQSLSVTSSIPDSYSRLPTKELGKSHLTNNSLEVDNKHTSVSSNQPIEVFFSYCHKDERFRDELEKHLSLLKRQGVITSWHDRKIGAGQEWKNQINTHLNTATVILLLISSDFIASDYCWDVEVNRAMERHEAKQARVIPVILRPTDWKNAPFAKLQALPKDGRPVIKWHHRDEAFSTIAQGIRAAVEELAGKR